MKDMMIDLETMGTTPGSAIVSIGAVSFDLAAGLVGDTFYRNVHLADSVNNHGFTLDPATVTWWLKQSNEARDALTKSVLPVEVVLQDFATFWAQQAAVSPWGNSASFDCSLLGAAYRKLGKDTPWRYQDERCYRTVRELYDHVPVDWESRSSVHHNALDDAMFQVEHLMKIRAWIKEHVR